MHRARLWVAAMWWRKSMKFSATKLFAKTKSQEDKAYAILGARPGPEIDLIIRPVEPMCGKWYANGLTDDGPKRRARGQ